MAGRHDKTVQEQIQRLYDRALVIRFQAGDDTAFEEIVGEMHGRLRRFLMNSFRLQSADVEDVLQETWLDACHGLRRLRRPASMRPWLYRVSRNRALKHLRRHRRMVDLDGLTVPIAASSGAEQDELPDTELRSALASLSTAHREVVLLRFEEGLTYEEIASAIKCSIGTVRSRLHYAKSVLQNTLRRFDHDDEY